MLSTVKKVQFLSNHKLVCSVRQLFVLGPRCILFIALIHASIFADLLWERVTLMLSASKRMAKINGQPAFLCGRSSETLKYVFRKKYLCYTTEPKYSPLSIGRSGNFACFQQAIWKNSDFGILFSLFKILTALPQHPLPRLKVFLTFISCGEAALWETSRLVGCGAPVFLPLGPLFLLAGFGRARGISAAPKGNRGLSSRGWAATHGAAAPGNLALIGNFTTFQHSRQTPGAGQEITLNSCDRVYTAVRS